MFDNAIAELNYLELIVEEDVWRDISGLISRAIDYINDGRTVNGDLRDTCISIADEKNAEIKELQDELSDREGEIRELQEEVAELEFELAEYK